MFIWADAIVKALADIEHAIKASGGKINPLKAKWPRRVKVDPKTLPRPVSCNEEKDSTLLFVFLGEGAISVSPAHSGDPHAL